MLRIFRLMRVFRILKLGQRFQKLQIVAQAIIDSGDVMIMLTFVLGLTMLVFAAIVFEAERSVYSTFDPIANEVVCAWPLPSPWPICTACPCPGLLHCVQVCRDAEKA